MSERIAVSRPPLRDLGVAAAYALGLAVLHQLNGPVRPVLDVGLPPWAGPALALAGAAGLALRSTRPALTTAVTGSCAVAGLLLTAAPTLGCVLVFEVVFSGVMFGSRRYSRRVARGSLSLFVLLGIALWPATQDWREWAALIVVAALVLLIPLAWASEVRRHREAAAQAAEIAAQNELLGRLHAEAEVRAARTEMARDLHDVIASRLSAVALQSAAALSVDDDDVRRSALRSIRTDSVRALEDMQAMISLLEAAPRAPGTDTSPGVSALPELARSARAAGLDLALEVRDVPDRLPSAVDAAAYRIAQEAVANMLKHSGSGTGALSVRREGRQLVLEARNPLDPAAAQLPGLGTGLRNMRARAEAAGGGLRTEAAERWWTVRAVLPVPDGAPAGSPRPAPVAVEQP